MVTHTPTLVKAEVLDQSERGDGGQSVVRLSLDGRSVILKSYGLKRGRFRTLMRAIGSVLFTGKSSPFPARRRQTECELLKLWREQGFDVPEVVDPGRGVLFLLMEDLEGPNLRDHLMGQRGQPLEAQLPLVRQLARDCGRRHAAAVRLNEPRLLHERPTLEHILMSRGRLVWCDHELSYGRRHRVHLLVGRELAGLLWSLWKCNPDRFDDMLRAFVEAYPDRAALERVSSDLMQGSLPGLGWVFSLRDRGRRRSKFGAAMVARTLAELLRSGAAPAPEPEPAPKGTPG